ncbi:MAG: translocation/assembly module TamB, partial [Massilibacteroides sp.]|nr:translocation/assembly module TamB [Massilibacteroides sp.]
MCAIRVLKYIIVSLFILLWTFYAIPAILLNIPYIQNKVTETVASELSEYLNVPVKIGHIDIEWLNRIALEDLYLEDPNGTVLLEASHISAGFEFFPLLKKKFVFNTIRLFGFSLNLRKNTPSDELNMQFLIRAFSSKDTLNKESRIDLQLHSIMMRRGHLSYDILSEKQTPGKFNAKHLDIKNLSASLSVKKLTNDSLNAQIKKMSFEEVSGLSINKLSLIIRANRDSALINDLQLKLPGTDFKIPEAQIALKDINNTDELVNNARVNLLISPSEIRLNDLKAFIPAFSNFKETVKLSAEASGFINDINLKQLSLDYSDKLQILGKMELKGITQPEDTYLFGQLNHMRITNEGIKGLINNFSEKPVELPAYLQKL